ncbi:hypothetical protein [Umezawaea sp. Da 62-37]|uniref:hypothetical protein n=1 Tax=Umezawaea sp. Da 62-37 TaxID=3075927 RepID=UPI0028F72681|nr:hypothetical protein [Umezawaea sp. Da 62-37]WNV82217.1 hypothetical protein RM788_28865 [Umezawaea sp. Da 62-37]
MSHPCVRGCSGWWKAPAAERGIVVDVVTEVTVGNVAHANRIHRTDWSAPLDTTRDAGLASPG